jgi:tetratricopeptide (TPR) repeat protein
LFDAAVILSRSGHPDEAIPFWNRILEANPGHAQALLNLGVAHAKAGRDDLAIEAYERLLILRPDDAQVLRYLERARARLSDSTTAPGRTPAGETRSFTEGVLVP